jgi:hypothetical protein
VGSLAGRLLVARLRYTATDGLWILFWRDCDEHFHRYEPCPPSRSVQLLLEAIELDENGIFGS